MGYTHHYLQKQNFTESQWDEICHFAINVISNSNITLDFCEITNDEISFNGGCEVFTLYKEKQQSKFPWLNNMAKVMEGHVSGHYHFCKTRGLPYDALVVLILTKARLLAPGTIDTMTDAGRKPYIDALNQILNGKIIFKGEKNDFH